MRGAAGLLHGAGKTVGEDLILPRGLAVRERLEHDVVALLRERRAIPRAMECDEGTAAVARRELTPVVEGQVIGRPVAGEDRDRSSLLRTDADGLSAITPVLGRQDQLALRVVEVAFGPPIVGAALDAHQLLRRQIGALLGLVECRPVLRELVAAVLRRIDAHPGRIDRDAARVAEPGDEALREREPLPGPLGLVAPDAGSRLELGARLVPWRLGHPILHLAGVGGRAAVDVQRPARIDHERVHGMITR